MPDISLMKISCDMQDIFLSAAGWLLFGGMPVTFKSIVGLSGTFVGAFAYSYVGLVKHRHAHESQAQTHCAPTPSPSVTEEADTAIDITMVMVADVPRNERSNNVASVMEYSHDMEAQDKRPPAESIAQVVVKQESVSSTGLRPVIQAPLQ